MNDETKVRISVLYAVSLASIAIFLSAANLSVWIFSRVPWYLAALSAVALAPLRLEGVRKNYLLLSFTILFFLFALGAIAFIVGHASIPGDPIDAFILFLVASLIIASIRDSMKLLYSGLSFYIVGVFMLIAFAGIKVVILLADILDYYVNCIGEACNPYPFALVPSILLLLIAIPAAYPYLKREIFRREENDTEGA